ncbi:hypothetical protein K470DRAFT_254445 [Piedraia hortae CBS 480.64]|uniref:Uncharacterized protein n=1 Tax=Piedraia hortae CBS 480.64 TaxID=1314780 RepID=A0A6A7C9K0_9PEZI|nr:hypothetical protein K470DRAFT_254445 [Piedraia hortae CBS 480.64]
MAQCFASFEDHFVHDQTSQNGTTRHGINLYGAYNWDPCIASVRMYVLMIVCDDYAICCVDSKLSCRYRDDFINFESITHRAQTSRAPQTRRTSQYLQDCNGRCLIRLGPEMVAYGHHVCATAFWHNS